jgi:hypothetical protein
VRFTAQTTCNNTSQHASLFDCNGAWDYDATAAIMGTLRVTNTFGEGSNDLCSFAVTHHPNWNPRT